MGLLAWDVEALERGPRRGDEKPAPGSKAEAPARVESETGAVVCAKK